MKILLIAAIRLYRLLLSPWLGRSCRFIPTCSEYGLEAIERHGALEGTLLTAWRVGRCHPLGGGGLDPVPDRGPLARLWTWVRARLAGSPPPAAPAAPAAPGAPGASDSAAHDRAAPGRAAHAPHASHGAACPLCGGGAPTEYRPPAA